MGGSCLVGTEIPGTDKGTFPAGKTAAGFSQVAALGSFGALYFFNLFFRQYPQAEIKINKILEIIPDGCPFTADIPAVRAGKGT